MEKILSFIIFLAPFAVLFFSVWGVFLAKHFKFLYVGFAILCLPTVGGLSIWYLLSVESNTPNTEVFLGMVMLFTGPFALIGVVGFFGYMAVLGLMRLKSV